MESILDADSFLLTVLGKNIFFERPYEIYTNGTCKNVLVTFTTTEEFPQEKNV